MDVTLHVISTDGSTRFEYTGKIVTVDRYFIEVMPDGDNVPIWINKGCLMSARAGIR